MLFSISDSMFTRKRNPPNPWWLGGPGLAVETWGLGSCSTLMGQL